ncbi:MAG TPA: hypothetical protein PLV92_10455, partial [Pirellulaceae bacterium]|nr:hypothetical protein [Pirellulaceae bacterium]
AAGHDSQGAPRREAPSSTLVYAIGQLDIDFQTEANRDAFRQLGVAVPDDRQSMYDFLTAVSPRSAAALSRIASLGAEPQAGAFSSNAEFEAAVRRWRSQVGVQLTSLANPLPHMAYAEGLTWVMTQDSTPVYAILAGGAYGAQTLSLLVDFLGDQLRGDSEYIALPGHIVGSTQLLTGYEVPVVVPDLRGLANWRRADLINAALTELGFNPVTDEQRREVEDEISNLLGRIYHELRNLGILPQDRALNFSATNVFQFATAYARDIRKELFRLEWKLDKVAIERSTVCRPGSDCWDIKLIFFEPAKRLESTRRVHRFTVDVSQVIPVTVGPVRSWYIN